MDNPQKQEEHAPVYRPEGTRKIKGLFSTQTVEKVGTGTTQRKTISKMFWFCTQNDAGEVLVQAMNKNNVPAGATTAVPLDDFLAKYNPEPEMYVKTVYPKMQELGATVQRAEEQRQRGALYSAQFEFENALAVDEENVRANFGLGLTYVERGEAAKAKDILGRIVGLDAAFAPEHKHLFNEFGISLRKSRMVDQAIEYYTRALTMTETDENLHYNVARAYYDKGDLDKCREHLERAKALNPAHEEVGKFLEFLNAKK
ncbi:MAG: tetratricopeptide repeat protein [Proteobacteria bacterium]|nr:tetratricopeptide repeat protein [Pseudomonadota bacterium]MBU1595443.1 tetratricopeptide repeat protein [Pseudomonadota bacterium]